MTVALMGALPAAPVAFLFGWLLDIDWERIYLEPWMLYPAACLGGICHAVSFYLFGVLPLEHLRPRMRGYPRTLTWVAILAVAAMASAVSSYISFKLVKFAPVVFIGTPPERKLAVLTLLLMGGAGLAVVLARCMIAEAEARERALAGAAAVARAHALQAQISPHFFFNTLTTISALAELDSRAAQTLVGRLAQLFRYTLSCSRCEMVALADELEFVANYLSIEQARLGRRLRFELPPAERACGVVLPGLTLQPLVENAVKHGIARRRDGGEIRLGMEVLEAACVLSVVSPLAAEEEGGRPLPKNGVFREGHSLANTRDRLALAFPGKSSIDFVMDGPERVKVVVRVPTGGDAR